MPLTYQAAGRIVSLLRNQAGLELTILRDQRQQTFHFSQPPENSEFFSVGDLVAIVSEQEIVLLAPQKAAPPGRFFHKAVLSQWSDYLQFLREFFRAAEFLEIKTPSLVTCPGTEPSLDVFSTTLSVGSKSRKLYLPTSPELHLKKALALGAEKIFEMAPCYRNGEITERHQPEFLMLEWYRAYDHLGAIKQDVLNLVDFMVKKMGVPGPQKIRSFSVAELFKIYCDFELTPQTSLEDLRSLAEKLEVDVHSAESIDDFFFLIFMDKIESQLPKEELIFVEKYPPYQAALARLTADGWGDRFEVYWKGLELANAFHELNDPEIQRLRSSEDLEKKKALGKESVNLDDEFFQCLDAGLPPSGGIALGVERLFMALTDTPEIKDLRLFPFVSL